MKLPDVFRKVKKGIRRDHITLISLVRKPDGYLYGMTIDFVKNTFVVSRSKVDEERSLRSEEIDYDIFSYEEKLLFDRYGRFEFSDGDRYKFDETLTEVFNKYVLEQ